MVNNNKGMNITLTKSMKTWISSKAESVINKSENTRPIVPISVASNPELKKQLLSLEGVTWAIIEVVTPRRV